MLNDEEKKALEILQKFLEDFDFDCQECGFSQQDEGKALKILFNLIEKQSKEIEELTDKNKKLKDKAKELIFEKQELTSALLDSTPKDKIKAKIEELEKEQEDNRKVLYNAVNNLYFKEIDIISNKISVNMSIRDILQSLLEKE